MILAALSLLMALPSDGPADCHYEQNALLALDLEAFDHDMDGGWRTLEVKGCGLEAANLIRDWRRAHGTMGSADALLSWHEGQLRADAGQYAAAIKLFDAARNPAAEDAKWGWNLYVDGSIAFLRGDRDALEAAGVRLAALPRPAELKDAIGADGKPRAVRWPMNLRVLDNFLRCWGQSYRVAYRCPL